MTDWNNLLNSVNQKVIGIINSTKDSFTGDGVFENKERLGFLLKTAEEKGNKVDCIDLYKEKFNPVFSGEKPDDTVLDHQRRIEK